MARSRLIDPINDLVTDAGAVLFSFVRGEQLEFPVTLSFLTNASSTSGYIFEAKVLEANNVAEQGSEPTSIRSGGVQTTINVRQPIISSKVWGAGTSFDYGDIIQYSGNYYMYTGITGSTTAPGTTGSGFVQTYLNIVYLQFPKTLASDWANIATMSTVTTSVYGYFELRVTEPNSNTSYRKTWKPVRGLVEILYSPTYSVDDVG